MAYEIIMPVLGMSQDTGVIAAWCKSVGDYVNAGDAIMEVETDKALQEIEAAESGYLTKILYPQNAKVPVGEVVGLISEEKLDNSEEASAVTLESKSNLTTDEGVSLATPSSDQAENVSDDFSANEVKEHVSATLEKEQGYTNNPLVLASGKARAIAYQHQLSLADVSVALGKNPLRAADMTAYLERLTSDQSAQPVGIGAQSIPVTTTQMAFRVSQVGLKHCEDWLASQQNISCELTSSHLIATLVSGLWRQMVVEDNDTPITINIERATSNGFCHSQLQDADLQRFSKLNVMLGEQVAQADLQLIDLRRSSLCEYQPCAVVGPLLVVTKDRKQIKISLYGISADQNITALRLMDALAYQLEEPLIHIA